MTGTAGLRPRLGRPSSLRGSSPSRIANGAWLAVQIIAHNIDRWTGRLGLGAGIVTTKTLRRRLFAIAGRITRSARQLTLHLPARWP
ncbi:MAG: hypothetical protein ACYDCI_10240 [Candidatus Limnocylindrales bacterium]